MKPPKEDQALQIICEHLKHLIGKDAYWKALDTKTLGSDLDLGIYQIITSGEFRFILEYKSSEQLGVIFRASEQSGVISRAIIHLSSAKQYSDSTEIPLLVVPFMGEKAIKKCAAAGISWLDLSGNADIIGPGLRIYVRGKKNKFKSPGRQENPFAPKSSRITRHLLYHPGQSFTQRELATETNLGEGFVSRIVKTLEAQEMVIRDNQNRVSARQRPILLDAWEQRYNFSKNTIIRGHIAGRSGAEIQTKLSNIFYDKTIEHAATGLGAAWLYSKFATFRTTSFYLKQEPIDDMLNQIGFRKDSSGANLWLIIPKDIDVFKAVKPIEGVPCVHPVQVYLDLKGHPERSEEAAEELRLKLEL